MGLVENLSAGEVIVSDLKESLRVFEASLKVSKSKDPADAYADEVQEFATKKLKPLLKEVQDLAERGKRMGLRYEYGLLDKVVDPLESAVEGLEDL